MAMAKLSCPPGSVPRSVIEYCCPGDAGCPVAGPVPTNTAATTAKSTAAQIVRFIASSPFSSSEVHYHRRDHMDLSAHRSPLTVRGLLLLQRGYALPLVLEAELLVASLLAVSLRLRSLHQLVSPGVAGLPLRALHPTLVCRGRRAGILAHQVHRRAIWLEGYGEGGASVICEAC